MLGEALWTTNRRRRSPVPDGEHDDAGGVFGASGVGRLGEEDERNEAELVGTSRGRGGGSGHGYGERRRRTRSVVLRERAQEGEGFQGESEGVERECVASPGCPGEAASRSWRRAGARGATMRPVLLAEEEDDKGGHWWAGLATWAAGKRQVIPLSLFSLIVSVFYFL